MGIYLEHALALPANHPARSGGAVHQLITEINQGVTVGKPGWNPIVNYDSLTEALRETCRKAMAPNPENRQYRFVYITTGEGDRQQIRRNLRGWPESARAVIILVGEGVKHTTWFIQAAKLSAPNNSVIAVVSETVRLEQLVLERVILHLASQEG